MTGLVDAAFSRKRVVLAFLVVSVLFGLGAYNNIPREAEPDIPFPFVMVTVPLPGISPEDGDRLIARPTSLELQSLEGLVEINSFAYEGSVRIIVEFETDVNIDTALIDVREKVDTAKAKYPSDAEEPLIDEFNAQTMFPIISIILSGDAPERAIYQAARSLKDKLESVSGVLDATLQGSREELLEVIIDPATLSAYNLTQQEIISAIVNNNRLVAAGALDGGANGKFAVKVPGVFKTVEDVMGLPLITDGDRVVTMSDVADVRRTFVDATGFARLNGEPAIAIDINKRSGANIIATIDEVRAIVEAESENWPSNIDVKFFNDQSTYIYDTLSTLTSSILTAVVLVMIIVVAAIGMRSAVMVGIAIPSSFLMAFMLLVAFGYTLNFMIMFAMVLAVGLLVDSAIVIVEYADRRMAEGADRKDAYADAAKRMFWPIVSSTSTTLAVFIPLLFWGGGTGEFMKFFPITLIFILCSSLVVALIFLPVIGSLLGQRGGMGQLNRMAMTRAELLANPGPVGIYGRVVDRLIRKPLTIIVAALTLTISVFIAFVASGTAVEFFVKTEPNEIQVIASTQGNLSATEQLELIQEIAEGLRGIDGIELSYTITGPTIGQEDGVPQDAIGKIRLDLKAYGERRLGAEILDDVRAAVAEVPGMVIEIQTPEGGPPVGKDVQLEIKGDDPAEILSAAKKVRAFMETSTTTIDGVTIPTYTELEDSSSLKGIEWSLEVDRAQAARFGADIASLGGVIQLVTNGILVDRYRPDDAEDEIDIRVRYPLADRGLSELDQLRVPTADGMAPLSNFVTRQAVPQVDRILRRDSSLFMEVKANGNANYESAGVVVNQGMAGDILKEWLKTDPITENVTWRMRGADEETQEAAAFFEAAMAASLFMMGVILLLQFNSFYHSILTLSAVVLSVVGVLLGILITGQYLSVIMTGIGIFALAGIVVNNNIVLIDTFQFNRKLGLSIEDAVIRTTMQRVRPVLLTTITTVCGLLPMVFQLNVNFAAGTITFGSETSLMWVILSSAIVFGLTFSTLLTLVLTPVMLAAPQFLPQSLAASYQRVARLIGFQKGRSTSAPGRDPAQAPAE